MRANLPVRTAFLQPFLCLSRNLPGLSCFKSEPACLRPAVSHRGAAGSRPLCQRPNQIALPENPVGSARELVLNVLNTDRIIANQTKQALMVVNARP